MPTVGVSERIGRRALRAPRRRLVLDYLDRCEGPVTVEELAAAVVSEETGASPERVTRTQRGPVEVSLERSHLPVLHGRGFVAWDSGTGTVRLTEQARKPVDREHERETESDAPTGRERGSGPAVEFVSGPADND